MVAGWPPCPSGRTTAGRPPSRTASTPLPDRLLDCASAGGGPAGAVVDPRQPGRQSQEQADRDAILSLLHRQEVKQIAAQAGLSLQKAEAAVSTLNGSDLRDLAAQSRQVQNDLAGGASNIVISTTTIIIVLLIIILIVLIAD